MSGTENGQDLVTEWAVRDEGRVKDNDQHSDAWQW